MNMNEPASRKPLRVWPGVVVAVLLVLVRLMPIVVDEVMPIAMMGAVVGGLLILLWWLFLSRAPWSERLGVTVLMIGALFVTSRLVHESITGGAMGFLFYVWAIPTLGVALVASVAASRRLSSRIPPRVDRCGDPARVRSVDAHTNRRCHQRHRRFGFPLALDRESRATAPRSGRRQSAGAVTVPRQPRFRRNQSRPGQPTLQPRRPLRPQPRRRGDRRTEPSLP